MSRVTNLVFQNARFFSFKATPATVKKLIITRTFSKCWRGAQKYNDGFEIYERIPPFDRIPYDVR